MNASRVVSLIVIVLAACQPGDNAAPSAHDQAESPPRGVWRLAEIREGNGTAANDPASLFIFTDRHYSMMRVTGPQPRALFAATQPTDAEKIRGFDTFIANAGSYEVSGTTVMTHPVVSKHPNFMGGGRDQFEMRAAGDTLWLTSSSADFRWAGKDSVALASQPATQTIYKLLRIE